MGEVFREHGYEGATLTRMTQATGLGKGSLYHLFPGGKEEIAGLVLEEIAGWFEAALFGPLREEGAIERMFAEVARYFRSGGRVCLVGVFALGDTRDRFAVAIRAFFRSWVESLADALAGRGWGSGDAVLAAGRGVGELQGALVLARALGDEGVFLRRVAQVERELCGGVETGVWGQSLFPKKD